MSIHKSGKTFKVLLTDVLTRYASELACGNAEETFGEEYVKHEQSLIKDLLESPDMQRM